MRPTKWSLEIILDALSKSDWDIREAAKLLGIPEKNLRTYAQRRGIKLAERHRAAKVWQTLAALMAANWHIPVAARALNISRQALYVRLAWPELRQNDRSSSEVSPRAGPFADSQP